MNWADDAPLTLPRTGSGEEPWPTTAVTPAGMGEHHVAIIDPDPDDPDDPDTGPQPRRPPEESR
ncbi:hypothetical protein ACIQXD_13970 [Streptomyces uncialis]|uniref:hypothetical protein n=1 Tax=Streptomyces uncialis TaxID=1048205 RepID=UPI0038066461